MTSLVERVPDVKDLLSLDVEDLAEIVLEIIPTFADGRSFWHTRVATTSYPEHGNRPRYPENKRDAVSLAAAEALSWLQTQGLIMDDPGQAQGFLMLTRRGHAALEQGGVAAFRYGGSLPSELLHPELIQKARPQFLRGDYDVAVFQAYKLVEVHVRAAANAVGANYRDNAVGIDLMRQAFHPQAGPLSDTSLVPAERQAMSDIFAGAIGHAKNPPGHRETDIEPMEAARLIIFASYLLDLVFKLSEGKRAGH